MNKTTIPIKGMHCRSCEILIEDKLKELPEIKSVSISYKLHAAVVFSKQPISHEMLRQKIEEAGYEVGKDEPKEWISTNVQTYSDLSIGLVILIALFFILGQFGVFNLSVGSLSNPSGLGVVLLIGLTAGFSSCMALVGGLVLGISARHAEKHPEATPAQKFRPHLFFNLGRISSYFLLGGLIGLVGKAFQLSGPLLGFLTILVGLVMLLVGLQLTELSPRLAGFKLTLPPALSRLFGLKERHEKEYSHYNSALVGALTFFLPCGFTQAMQLYAMSTGSFLKGALIMAIFAIGTAPGLLGVGGLTSVIKGVFARRFFKFAGIVVVILAIFNLSNGFNLTGISAKFPVSQLKVSNQADPNVTEEGGFQIVLMTQDSNGYHPNSFTIKKGVPVKWVVTSISAGSCATSLSAPQINIRKFLQLGENDFEFLPKETGKINFSCSMGMYRGSFNVVENTDAAPDQNTQVAPQPVQKQPAPAPSQVPEQSSNRVTTPSGGEQIIKTVYTKLKDIQPSEFAIKVGVPVRFEIAALDDGSGCMSSITVPALTQDYDELSKGKTTVLKFTATKPGTYKITCAMGVERGAITAT